MGIPVIDVVGSYSFVQVHPYWAALIFAGLTALFGAVLWFSRKFPKHQGRLRFGIFAVCLPVALVMVWAGFNPAPSPMMQFMDAAHHQVELVNTIQKTQLITSPEK